MSGSGRTADGIAVGASEDGLKLLGLLERRLGLPRAMLHRWIRTGQVRVDGSRAQPFSRVAAGSVVRIPPFAPSLAAEAAAPRSAVPDPGLEILADDGEYLAVFKPAGLATHPGTGHADSVASRLAALAGPGSFAPTPVHRLDRDTSGVLLAARTFRALERAHEALREREGIRKEYLAWALGPWPPDGAAVLRHRLGKLSFGGRERMGVPDDPADGREAVLAARRLREAAGASLLHVRIFTGVTHQIRAQLAIEGHPVLGDRRYGGGRMRGPLLLHSLRLVLPDGRAFEALPRWEPPRGVARLPEPLDAEP